MKYVFRVSYSQALLDAARSFDFYEDAPAPPRSCVQIRLQSDGYDIPCATPPEFLGRAEDVEQLKTWLYENDSTPPPGRLNLESCTPRQVYWPLHSPAGRAAWAWEIESDDEATDFDAPPDYPSVDASGNVILY